MKYHFGGARSAQLHNFGLQICNRYDTLHYHCRLPNFYLYFIASMYSKLVVTWAKRANQCRKILCTHLLHNLYYVCSSYLNSLDFVMTMRLNYYTTRHLSTYLQLLHISLAVRLINNPNPFQRVDTISRHILLCAVRFVTNIC